MWTVDGLPSSACERWFGYSVRWRDSKVCLPCGWFLIQFAIFCSLARVSILSGTCNGRSFLTRLNPADVLRFSAKAQQDQCFRSSSGDPAVQPFQKICRGQPDITGCLMHCDAPLTNAPVISSMHTTGIGETNPGLACPTDS